MNYRSDLPDKVPGSLLDHYLSQGKFRIRQSMFTCELSIFDKKIYPVHWLRLLISNLNLSRSSFKILQQNTHFTCEIKPFHISEEIEKLFSSYRSSIDFETTESVSAYLLNNSEKNRFNTQVFEIRDAGKLIAAGFVDMGRKSMAAILNFYHPEYKKCSPGKFVMLKEIEYSRIIGLKWYYPGYIANGYSKFDYKLFPDRHAFEMYDPQLLNWVPLKWPLPDSGLIFPEIADLIG